MLLSGHNNFWSWSRWFVTCVDQLLDFIQQVKDGINVDVPVSYMDAYYEFAERPRIAEACDVILANCYPFWEGCDMDYQGYVSKGCTCR